MAQQPQPHPQPEPPRGTGQGKLILLGEHAVVYHHPALVAGLARGATATARQTPGAPDRLTLIDTSTGEALLTVQARRDPEEPLEHAWAAILDALQARGAGLEVHVGLQLPPGAGLGSSAALAAATARAIAAALRRDALDVERAVHASESVFHGSPSGIDQAAALRGGLSRFMRGRDGAAAQLHALPSAPIQLAICQPAPGASTARMVAGVAALRARRPRHVDAIFAHIGALVADAEQALATGDLATLGDLLNLNHGALVALGVSTEALDAACHLAREAGAPGAKLTGAGGGGCVFALCGDARRDILAAWDRRGWPHFTVTMQSAAPDLLTPHGSIDEQ